ncbi:hypothetical protein [Desulfosporosinus shakirovi]|uniref:hypothetical protein n=1 Tax=Desulfosporosinus shakirovi TaxID=2885154 RepID=UPI001E41B4B5|nr:hypothetical protein [Desulfosporosinus sp. SRJS8]MCB8814727.1 hypothetical protein [Desulfosporosinus sp. SRJS8]
MEWNSVSERLKEIIQVDVMVNEKWDFMATHMPFNRLAVQFSGRTTATAKEMSEEEIYQQLVYNPNDEHRMIIVRGRNGAGKSHLIRWIRSRLHSNRRDETLKAEKVVFIRRIDNSVRGAMRQLIDQGVVSDPALKERLQSFIQSCDMKNEGELKSSIYYNFIIKIENEEEESSYKTAERKRLASFLRDDTIMNFLMREDGPVTRFYELIARPSGRIQGMEATFKADDFTAMRSIMQDIQRKGNPNTKRFFAEVKEANGAAKLVAYLNRFARAVIQTCANLSLGDAEGMIHQLRLDLKREGKALTVLIEDMTTFTGMDSELIKVLSIQHGGEYQDLCRVTSLIGITDEYYSAHFRDNFQDRVTHQITVDSATFESEETLAQMAARYINAAYLTQQETINWYNQGAEAAKLPYRTWQPDFTWESVDVEGALFSIFPLTKKALFGLYNRLPEKAPRFFIRDVIRIQMSAWANFQLGNATFPNISLSALGESPVQFLEMQHTARFDMLNFSNEEKNRLRVLLCIWGDGTLHEVGNDENRVIGTLPVKYLQLFGFNDLSGIQSQGNTLHGDQTSPRKEQKDPQVTAEVSERTRMYQNDLNDVENWYQNNMVLANSADARKRIYDFVIDAINWQMEGVPAYLVGIRLNTRSIFIEGQRQRSGDKEQALIVIERNQEGYWLLLALTHWGHNNSPKWDFKDSAFMQYKLILWLESHKATIISRLKGEPDTSPMIILQHSMALEFLRLGITGCLTYTEKDETVLKKLFMRSVSSNVSRNDSEDAWGRLLKNINQKHRSDSLTKNKDMLIALPNTHMGSVSRQGEIRKYLYHRDQIDDAFKVLKRLDWDPASLLPEKIIEKDELFTSAARQLQALLPGVKDVLVDERRKATEMLEQLKNELGEDLGRDIIVNASRKMADFLNAFNINYGGYYPAPLREHVVKIEENATLLARICKRAADLVNDEKFSLELAFFSSNPCQMMKEALDTIREVEKIANSAVEKAERDLENLRSTTTTDNTLLDKLKDGLIELIEQMKKFGGDNNA